MRKYAPGPTTAGSSGTAAITGGTINGTVIGGTTPAAGTFTNLAWTGVANGPAGVVGTPVLYLGGDTTTGWYRPNANQWGLSISGVLTHNFTSTGLTMGVNTAQLVMGSSGDAIMAFATTNSFRFGVTAASTVTSRTEINKVVTGIADAVATATFTVTIPNAAHSGILEFEVLGILGAGGAIGTNEAVASATYKISITRTPGVATVAVASAVAMAAAAAVAGAATVTCTAVVSSMTGAVGATQTFTLNVTITRSGGSSTNHIALCYGKLLNLNATGITIA